MGHFPAHPNCSQRRKRVRFLKLLMRLEPLTPHLLILAYILPIQPIAWSLQIGGAVAGDRYRPGTIKSVSLAKWQPGIFVAYRLAWKLPLPPKPPWSPKGAQGLHSARRSRLFQAPIETDPSTYLGTIAKANVEAVAMLPGRGCVDILSFA